MFSCVYKPPDQDLRDVFTNFESDRRRVPSLSAHQWTGKFERRESIFQTSASLITRAKILKSSHLIVPLVALDFNTRRGVKGKKKKKHERKGHRHRSLVPSREPLMCPDVDGKACKTDPRHDLWAPRGSCRALRAVINEFPDTPRSTRVDDVSPRGNWPVILELIYRFSPRYYTIPSVPEVKIIISSIPRIDKILAVIKLKAFPRIPSCRLSAPRTYN